MSNRTGFKPASSITGQILEGGDFCNHCTVEDHSKAVGYFYERDSFGLVAAYIVCEHCREVADKAEGEVMVQCHDCKCEHPTKDTIEWKEYDFNANAGEEPMVICNACKVLQPHIDRRARDDEAYRQEFPSDDSEYGDFGDGDDEEDDDEHWGPDDDEDDQEDEEDHN